MVHRIQNRNPGYSDFSNINTPSSFNLNATMSNTITSGANALKLENEVLNESETSSNLVDAHVLNTEDTGTTPKIDVPEKENFVPLAEEKNEEISNGLENFGIEEETPDLFNSNEENTIQEISSSDNEDDDEEEDFEIPAFLRRQKN